MNTLEQYASALDSCRSLFLKKTHDYGTAWRVMRTLSIADQIYIKAYRIRTIQEKKTQLVKDDIPGEFIGMVNYGIIGLIQLEINNDEVENLPYDSVVELYDNKANLARETMLQKNHDYGEAWRNMSQEGFTDLILMKVMRIRQILENEGQTLVSEGIDANYIDIINYSLFALILIAEKEKNGALQTA
jgi:hypothetical protein